MIVARRNLDAIKKIEDEARKALDQMHHRAIDIREGSARVVAAGVRLVKIAQHRPDAWAAYMDRLEIDRKGPGSIYREVATLLFRPFGRSAGVTIPA